jgi:Tfp pilus assembly protein PilO
MGFSLRRDSLITIGGVALSAAVFVFAIYLPGRKLSRQTKREIAAASQTVCDFPLRVAELNSLHQSVRERDSFLDRSAVLVPGEANVHAVLGQVTRLADTANLAVTRLEPLPRIEHESYVTLPFRLTCAGGFLGITAFLRGLEQESRLFAVQEFSIAVPDKQMEQTAQADIYFSVYVKRAEYADSAE